MTEASNLLANEVVMANPHGPANHANRTYRQLVPAALFDGTLTTVGGVAVITLTNDADVEIHAEASVPEGAVSLDSVRIYLLEPTGVVAAGNLFIGSGAQMFGDGDTVIALDMTPVETAFPAEGATRVARLVSQNVVLLPTSLDDILHVGVRRNATGVQDTFEDDVHLMGLWLDWSVDQ